MWLLDTNVFMRVLVREDEQAFADCLAILERVKSGEVKAITAGLVLAELVWVLKSGYRLKRDGIAEKVNGVRMLAGLKVIDDYDYGWAIEKYGSKKVKFIDACLASIPAVREGKVTVVSYDADFGKLDCKWKKPGELV